MNAEVKTMFDDNEPGITDPIVTRFLTLGNSGSQDFCQWNKMLGHDLKAVSSA